MILKRRILASAAFLPTVAMAGVAALAVTRAPAAAHTQLQDVQIGERGAQTRIAFLCGGECALAQRDDGAFYLSGVSSAFTIDLSGRSARVQGLKATPSGAGVVIGVNTAASIDYSTVKACTVGGAPAACLDIFFTEGAPAPQQQAAAKKTSAPKQAASQTPSQQIASAAAPAEKSVDAPAQRPVLEQPPLRESATDRLTVFAKLAAPERLAPPTAAMLAKVQPVEKAAAEKRPSILSVEPLAPPVQENYAERVRTILGKDLSAGYCTQAEETLQADAWAMSAMVDVGLCAAAAGDIVDGEEILARLLQYTPDNYEAYVGRALIAEQAGEKGVARKYYQDALNAPPPIEESTRIVEAMTALDDR